MVTIDMENFSSYNAQNVPKTSLEMLYLKPGINLPMRSVCTTAKLKVIDSLDSKSR